MYCEIIGAFIVLVFAANLSLSHGDRDALLPPGTSLSLKSLGQIHEEARAASGN